MYLNVNASTFWIFLIILSYGVSSALSIKPPKELNALKKEVEDVPGLMLPPVPNQPCMIRPNYECQWTYEKSCSCQPKRKIVRRFLEVSYIRSKALEKSTRSSANAQMPN